MWGFIAWRLMVSRNSAIMERANSLPHYTANYQTMDTSWSWKDTATLAFIITSIVALLTIINYLAPK